MIKITLNGLTVQTDPNKRIIEIADQLNISIPRFCYHPELSVVANCRMCLVEVLNVPKLLPACATYVADGMQIFTASKATLAAQQEVMELLLANHPLDCPVCEKAGECELQDLAIRASKDQSIYFEAKRKVQAKDFSSLIATNMTRCIHCTRCVRFAKEIAGTPELGAIYRGEKMQITNYPHQELSSEISGNIIDLCPVGALVAKPLRDGTKPWELIQKPGISCHDCVGSKIYYHVQHGQIKRIIPRLDPELNNLWLADRDRFGFLGINAADRLKHPLLKKHGKWYLVSWKEALEFIKQKLTKIIEQFGPQQIGGLISPNATLEECYVFQKFLRSLGCHNIDHRLRQLDFRSQHFAPAYPNLGLPKLADLAKQEFILLLGTYLNKEQPIAAIHVRKAIAAGAKVAVINPVDLNLSFTTYVRSIPAAGDLVTPMLKVLKAILELQEQTAVDTEQVEQLDPAWHTLVKNLNPEIAQRQIAEQLLTVKPGKGSIILGALATSHPEYTTLVAISNVVCQLTGHKFGSFSEGANSAGAWLAGCTNINSENSLNAYMMLQDPLKAYLLLGIEPELDCAAGQLATKTLAAAELVIGMTAFESEYLLKYSEVLLPIAVPQEVGGTYINVTGSSEAFAAVAAPVGDSRSATDLLITLAKLFEQNLLELPLEQQIKLIINKAQLATTQLTWQSYIPNIAPKTNLAVNTLIKIAPISLYAVDPIVRRSLALQATIDALPEILINSKTADYLDLTEQQTIVIKILNDLENTWNVEIKICDRVPDGSIFIKQVDHNTLIGIPYSKLIIEKLVEKS